MTLLRGQQGYPQNVEMTLELETIVEVEALQQAFISAGAKGQAPSDQPMYVPDRFCPVTDPFGFEIIIVVPFADGLTSTKNHKHMCGETDL